MSLGEIDPAFDLMTEFGKLTQHTTRHLGQMRQDALFSEGALSVRVKTLAALLWSISARCEPCIKFYAQQAVAHGVSESELGEMLAVASTMGGCVGETWALKAFKAYQDYTDGKTTAEADPDCCAIT
jgi:AhpD family alkylhydroperoxidase